MFASDFEANDCVLILIRELTSIVFLFRWRTVFGVLTVVVADNT